MVELKSADGQTTLAYDCDRIIPQAETANDMRTVIEHLPAVLKGLASEGRIVTLQEINAASKTSDVRAMELVIVRYLCGASSSTASERVAAFPLWVVGLVVTGLLSWLITHIYYKKALQHQAAAASEQVGGLLALMEQGRRRAHIDREIVRQKRIEEGVAEYRRAGTPVQVIDTYDDLTSDEKADLLDTIMRRVKGRPAKRNKYRRANG